jgi:hypothetical protein
MSGSDRETHGTMGRFPDPPVPFQSRVRTYVSKACQAQIKPVPPMQIEPVSIPTLG